MSAQSKEEEKIRDSCKKKKAMGLCSKGQRNELHEKLIDIYRQFLETRYCEPRPGELADYNWYSLPKNLPAKLFPYSEMLFEHAQELPNSINELHCYIVNLSVWEKVIVDIDQELKRRLLIEQITPFATLSINLIYVIKSRFFFSVAHLCHQANMIQSKKRSEELLPNDDKIYQEHADKAGSSWKEYKKLKLSLEQINNRTFVESTKDFRNRYNHRYSPKIEDGHTDFITRRIDSKSGKWSYGIGGHTEPLTLALLVPILTEQYTLILTAYSRYKKLIHSQIVSIENGLKR